MNEPVKRKLIYLAGMALALYLVFNISSPPTRENAGGTLFKMRADKRLGEVTLGDVDPTSHTLNFVLVGMRGIAANILWQEAHHLQERHQWNELKRCIKSITLLQPRFVSVWDFQGWNLAYNVSNEWDNVEDRYYWIKEGISFLEEGHEKNRERPELPWSIGKTYTNKIGSSDESLEFRKLFKEDKVFNPDGEDSFRVGKEHFRRAIETRDELRLYLSTEENLISPDMSLGTSPLVFQAALPLAQTRYAEVIEEEGTFGEQAYLAWQTALGDWREMGEVDFPCPEVGTVKLEYTSDERADLSQKDFGNMVLYWSGRYGGIVNYQGWKEQCIGESWVDQEGQYQTVEARRLTFLGNRAYDEGDLLRARELYDQAMQKWGAVTDKFDIYYRDADFVTGYVADLMGRYKLILTHLGELQGKEQWPEADFVLNKMWDRNVEIATMMELGQQSKQQTPGRGMGQGGGMGRGTGGGDSQPRLSPQMNADAQLIERVKKNLIESRRLRGDATPSPEAR